MSGEQLRAAWVLENLVLDIPDSLTTLNASLFSNTFFFTTKDTLIHQPMHYTYSTGHMHERDK